MSSVSIFGIVTGHSPNRDTLPSVEPVWVNGVMGVWDPDNGDFVPATSPRFDETCERIQRKRDQAGGYYYGGSSYYGHHWYYSPGSSSFSYSGSGAGYSSGAGSSDSHSFFGSTRGGIGETGHGFGGHGGGE